MWWRDLGWTDRAAALPSLLVIVLAALVLAWGRVTTGLAERGQPRERLLAALGAVVVLGCFLAGVNYAYRWIFALWPAVWLWRQAGADAPPGRTRWAARFSCVLVLLGLWLDGVLCVVVNLFFRDQAVVWRNAPDVTWRQWTQPLHWMLMMLLAGWLVEGAWATLREWWSLRHED